MLELTSKVFGWGLLANLTEWCQLHYSAWLPCKGGKIVIIFQTMNETMFNFWGRNIPQVLPYTISLFFEQSLVLRGTASDHVLPFSWSGLRWVLERHRPWCSRRRSTWSWGDRCWRTRGRPDLRASRWPRSAWTRFGSKVRRRFYEICSTICLKILTKLRILSWLLKINR